jgi:hypothetical protein
MRKERRKRKEKENMRPIFDFDLWPYAILRFEQSAETSNDDIERYFDDFRSMYDRNQPFSILIQAEFLDVPMSMIPRKIQFLMQTHALAKQFIRAVGIWCPDEATEKRMNGILSTIKAVYTPSSDIRIFSKEDEALSFVAESLSS